MNPNLRRGKPYQSRLRSLLPVAVGMRKGGASWAQIAAELSERAGETIPLTTLYEAATKWIRRRSELDSLPDVTGAGPVVSPEPPASSPSITIAPVSWDEFEDEPKGPIIKINRNSTTTEKP